MTTTTNLVTLIHKVLLLTVSMYLMGRKLEVFTYLDNDMESISLAGAAAYAHSGAFPLPALILN